MNVMKSKKRVKKGERLSVCLSCPVLAKERVPQGARAINTEGTRRVQPLPSSRDGDTSSSALPSF